MRLRKLIERHPVLTFFLLVNFVAWGGILILIGPGGLDPAATRPMEMEQRSIRKG